LSIEDLPFQKREVDEMKKIMILDLLILLSAPMVWAQEKCEAPKLNVGDKWRYGDKSRSE
jgi:hypothetical protein